MAWDWERWRDLDNLNPDCLGLCHRILQKVLPKLFHDRPIDSFVNDEVKSNLFKYVSVYLGIKRDDMLPHANYPCCITQARFGDACLHRAKKFGDIHFKGITKIEQLQYYTFNAEQNDHVKCIFLPDGDGFKIPFWPKLQNGKSS